MPSPEPYPAGQELLHTLQFEIAEKPPVRRVSRDFEGELRDGKLFVRTEVHDVLKGLGVTTLGRALVCLDRFPSSFLSQLTGWSVGDVKTATQGLRHVLKGKIPLEYLLPNRVEDSTIELRNLSFSRRTAL